MTASRSSERSSILTDARALSPLRAFFNTRISETWQRRWPLLAAVLILAIPTMFSLAQQTWSTDAGAHGPIVLATGIWLVSQMRRELVRDAQPISMWALVVLLIPCLAIYAFGRAFDLLIVEVLALFGIAMAIMLRLVGVTAIWRNPFPFIYLGFLIPIPLWALEKVTAPLQLLVSTVSADILQWAGYPVAREGVTIFVAQYQLLVEEACSGMNSLTGLIAIGLFYVYVLHRASWKYVAILLAAILPIAILTNIIRVIILILLTYYKGDAVAQGFLHNTAGMLVFVVALAMIVALDKLLQLAVGTSEVSA